MNRTATRTTGASRPNHLGDVKEKPLLKSIAKETEPTTLMNGVDLIVFQISRTRIERADWAWAAHRFNADPMPLPQLHAWFGRVVWCFAGYDSDPTELYAIEEVRRFLAAWRVQRPHWLFFASLENDNLKIMYLALLRAAASVGNNHVGQCQVVFDRQELGNLLAADLEVADGICERIGLSPARRLRRAQDVLRYFGFSEGGDL